MDKSPEEPHGFVNGWPRLAALSRLAQVIRERLPFDPVGKDLPLFTATLHVEQGWKRRADPAESLERRDELTRMWSMGHYVDHSQDLSSWVKYLRPPARMTQSPRHPVPSTLEPQFA